MSRQATVGACVSFGVFSLILMFDAFAFSLLLCARLQVRLPALNHPLIFEQLFLREFSSNPKNAWVHARKHSLCAQTINC